MEHHRTKFFWIVWGLAVTAIIISSVLPQIPTPEKYNMDKFVHACAYGLVALYAFLLTNKRSSFFIIFALLILMGGGIEIIQTQIPYRSGTIGDFAADVIGTIGAALISKKLKPIMLRRKK